MPPHETGESTGSVVSTRTMEMATAAVFLLLAAVIMWDSWKTGARWGSDGPQSGYFPFYVAWLMGIASAINLWRAYRMGGEDSFVTKPVLRLVLAIFLPSLVYVGLMQWTGLYLASALFMAIFMRWQGKFRWITSGMSGLALAMALFLMFEVWFKIPLPKGPLEAALGF